MTVSKLISVNRPPDFIGKIVEELGASLDLNERELLGLLGFSDCLCCLSVANRERAAGRISTSQEQVEHVTSLLESLGLSCHRSALDILPQPDLIRGNVSHSAVYVPQGSEERALAVIYFGLDAEFAIGAESAELNKELALVGRLFGYPECCSEFFMRNDGFNEDRTPASIPDSGPFPSILNPVIAELYGFRLPFHFACSPRCPQSLSIARMRLKYLKQYVPSISIVEKLGAGIAIYGPSIGASLVTRYTQAGPNSYLAEEVITRVEWEPKMMSFGQKTHHNVRGNPMRFSISDSAIRLDETWKNHLGDDDLDLFEELAGPLSLQLGYDLKVRTPAPLLPGSANKHWPAESGLLEVNLKTAQEM